MNNQELQEAIDWLDEDCKYLDKQIEKYRQRNGLWFAMMKLKLEESWAHSMGLLDLFKNELENRK